MNHRQWSNLFTGVIVVNDGTPIHPSMTPLVEYQIGKYVNELISKGYNRKDINIALDGNYVRIFDPISLRGNFTITKWLISRQ